MAPSTAAPPAMSYFIFSIPSAGFMEMPPLSNRHALTDQPEVIGGRWSPRWHVADNIIAGGSVLPCATPSSEAHSDLPHPILIQNFRKPKPNSSAHGARAIGQDRRVIRLAGSLARSRVKFCASARICPRSTAFSNSAPLADEITWNESSDLASFNVLWTSVS